MHASTCFLGGLQLATLGAAATNSSTSSASIAIISSSSSTTAPTVPTGTPIAGDYNGRYRPQVHFSPPKNFMNDPNGMFRDANGTWHLYYQYNPTGNVAGNQHWGHATSDDLYHWINQPIALFPPKDNQFVFSGSAVIDTNNTSGFFPDQTNGVIAVYTLAEYNDDGPGPQNQNIAVSHDGGYTFTPYEKNPVIASNSSQFRDPKVIRYDDHWVMAVAYPYDFEIGIFTSKNLIDWAPASNFSHHGLLALQWECPNLVKMPYIDEKGDKHDDMWLLAISVNPGAPVGGSIMQYYPGKFNGTHFEAVDSAARIADFGKDNYAGQFFYEEKADSDPVFIAWASNWQYTQVVPTGEEGWRSAMSLPRKTYLKKAPRLGWKLISEPYDLTPVRGDVLEEKKDLGNGTVVVDFSDVESNAIYWTVDVTGIPKSNIPGTATLNFTIASPITGENVRGGFFLGGDTPFFIDRSGTKGFDNVFFTDKFSTNSLLTKDTWSMSGVFDRSILEVFVDGGLESATNTFFATQPLTLFSLSTAKLPAGVKVSVRVEELKSTWADLADSKDGLVHGNITAPTDASMKIDTMVPNIPGI